MLTTQQKKSETDSTFLSLFHADQTPKKFRKPQEQDEDSSSSSTLTAPKPPQNPQNQFNFTSIFTNSTITKSISASISSKNRFQIRRILTEFD
jgi:hypothetical protein